MIQNLPPRAVSNLLEYLTFEIQRTRSERAPLEQDWIRYGKVYRPKMPDTPKDFPFKGAAQVVVPVAATDVDTTVSGLMGALFASPNLWSCEGLRPDALEMAARLEEFLEWAQETELGMYNVCTDWITEIVKLGTGVLKQRYRRDQKRMWEWREVQGPQGVTTIQQMITRLAVDRPDVSYVPLANWYVPSSATSIESAAWCGERLELSWNQLEARVRAGIYQPDFLTRIGAHWRQSQPKTEFSQYRSAQEELDHFLPGMQNNFELFEFWTDYDATGSGEPNAVVCTIHIPSMSYARIDWNPFFHQEKPYSLARFLRQEGRIYGIGLIEMLEMIQETVSTMTCQRIDNGTIRNAAVYKGRRGSGVRQDEPIWPGRTILMDDPEKDLVAMNMGYPVESTLQEEQFLIQYGRERSSVSDYQRGGAGNPAISYSTATTTVEMLKQGKLRLDQVLREIQSALTQTGQRVVELYQQYDQGGKTYQVMGEKDGAVVNQILRFPLTTIRTQVAIKVTATNAQANKETKIRTDQIIFGLVAQFYQQLFQGMQIVVNPQVPPPLRALAGQMVSGGLVLARRILDSYGTQDIDQIIPDLEALNATVEQIGQLGTGAPGGQPNPGPEGLAPGPGNPSGVPALPAGAPSPANSGFQAFALGAGAQ